MCFRGLGPPGSPVCPRQPHGDGEGLGAGATLVLAGSRWVRIGHRLGPRGSGLGRAGEGTQPPAGAALVGTRECQGFRLRHAGAACCRRGRDVELRRGPRAGASGAGDADAPVSPPYRLGGGLAHDLYLCSLPPRAAPSVPPALPHLELRLCGSQRLCSASRAQAGGSGPQRGVGTRRVTDLFECGGWGRVRCARTIFLYSKCCPWDQSC